MLQTYGTTARDQLKTTGLSFTMWAGGVAGFRAAGFTREQTTILTNMAGSLLLLNCAVQSILMELDAVEDQLNRGFYN